MMLAHRAHRAQSGQLRRFTTSRVQLAEATQRPSSALLVNEGRPSVYESDKEMLRDINTLINGLIPMHTLRGMRDSLQPRARVKWDRHIEFAEKMTKDAQEKLSESFGTQSDSQVPDLVADHCFPDWKSAITAFLNNSIPPAAGIDNSPFNPLGDGWDFSNMSENPKVFPPKQWFRHEYVLLKAKPEKVERQVNTVEQARERVKTQEFLEGVDSQAAFYDQLNVDNYLEKFRVAAEIQKDINAGKFNPALQLRVDEFKKKLSKDDRVAPVEDQPHLISITTLKEMRAQYVHDKYNPLNKTSKQERKHDYDMMTTAIKTAKQVGLKPLVPFLKLIRNSFKEETPEQSAVLVQDLLRQIPPLQDFLQTRAFFSDDLDIPGYADIKAQIDSEYSPPVLNFTYEEGVEWAKIYTKRRMERTEEKVNAELAKEYGEDLEDEHQRVEDINPLYDTDRIVVISFKLKSVFISEIILPFIDPEMPGKTETAEQRTKIIDIPSRWLLAFKKVQWPEYDDAGRAVILHSPTEGIAFEDSLSKQERE